MSLFQKGKCMPKQGQRRNKTSMKKIKLNEDSGLSISKDGYRLDSTEKYIINIENEIETQTAILASFQVMGAPPAIKNYHAWLFEHGFDINSPNPTNEFVSQYYGVGPLWKTDYSQGIVVKAENNDDYFIVMECSSKNRGYKHTQVILTLGGCL